MEIATASAKPRNDASGSLLKKLWKILEDCGRKWKIIHTFVTISVKEYYDQIYRRI